MAGTQFEYGPTHIVLTVVVSVGVYIYYGIAAGRIFAKAGVTPWQAWVPFLNSWRLLQLGGQPGWWLLVGLVPLVGQIIYLVMYVIAQWRIGIALGKPSAFVLLAILLGPLWFGILAFDRSTWQPRHASLVPASALR